MREFYVITYLFLPLLVGLALHGFCIKYDLLSFLYHPIDRGRKFRGKRIFGENKTYRGVVVVSLGTAIGFALQSLLFHRIASVRSVELFDYAFFKSVSLGLAVGVAAMLSELPNSFIKRQFEIAPGTAAKGWKAIIFYVYDQIDFLLGAWLVLAIVVPVTIGRVLFSAVLLLIAHQIMSSVGYALGMRRTAR
ncbi:MAG TPA: CDP-archaeol synthase [Blastocatellia bacterium]|nr:CDP-archaeol synthase [Blastocatellia bacterium]